MRPQANNLPIRKRLILVNLKCTCTSIILTVVREDLFVANVSVFRSEIAEYLDIDIQSRKEIFLGGVGGRIQGYIHKLKFKVGGRKFNSPVVFSYEFLVSFNLLGRNSFFKNFIIIFNEKKRLVELK